MFILTIFGCILGCSGLGLGISFLVMWMAHYIAVKRKQDVTGIDNAAPWVCLFFGIPIGAFIGCILGIILVIFF